MDYFLTIWFAAMAAVQLFMFATFQTSVKWACLGTSLLFVVISIASVPH